MAVTGEASAPLTPDQIAIVKSTAPALKAHGEEITSLFYKNMLAAHPELRNIFNKTSQETGAQPRALAGAVFAYASYVDDLGQLSDAVARIAHKHVSLMVTKEQYPIVGEHLIAAVATVLGDAVTPAVAEAWTAAYQALADIFIGLEGGMYTEQEKSAAGWNGWRKFKIAKKVPESAEITSFYLTPEDGKLPLPDFKPGQYVSLHLHVPELGCMQPRQYSLSDVPGQDCYRISVKRDAGKLAGVPGLISNRLHSDYQEGDVVEITHPAGTFSVEPKTRGGQSPMALISAGVGVTPMVSILNATVAEGSARPVSWVHGARSTEVQAFAGHVQGVCEKNPNVKATIFKKHVKDGEVEGVDYHFIGRMDLERVDRKQGLFLDEPEAHYYICGPPAFMRDVRQFLVKAGVGESRIHIEVFGVGDGE
ncbi:flavohemo protein [Apiospora phragmitis]|uniref:nitric oxide dioxygenase n=1 Tax=Apiospora phragmitis TaxID=2905665 RepID=A0ABR1WSI8_9PEZI